MKNYSIIILLMLLTLTAGNNFSMGKNNKGKKVVPSMFWTWQDSTIENKEYLLWQLNDLKSAGFKCLYAVPRATRYQLYDKEMIDAVKFAGDACKKEGIEFVWGADPRFAARQTTQKTGYGAELLIVNSKFKFDYNSSGPEAEKLFLNECKVNNNKYSLRYEYPSRRDIHMLTEVSLWLNPIGVDKVFAYQKKDGKVLKSSVKDITPGHHFFVNRSFYYVEVFGKTNLPAGDWYVIAFPRFMTNNYAYDSPAHEKILFSLLDEYKKQNVHFDGFWWDEPGYYFQYGQYAISSRIYNDFKNKYKYDLKSNLYALLLDIDDNSHLKVRYDYFQLLMDYVFGSEKRFWEKGEKLFGSLRMGIHQTWHTLPDNMNTGCADYWRGLEAVDGGYTDDEAFEHYFKTDLAGKYEETSFMILASSLAKFSKSGIAHYNRWGTNYGKEVPTYWNDLMTLFSNEWIQHCYGYTGIIGASRDFGPGFPNHETWKILPDLIKRTQKVVDITKYNLLAAEVAIVYPLPAFLTERQPVLEQMMGKLNRLTGIMPALGIQADVISDWLLAEGKINDRVLQVRNQKYKAVLLPFPKVVTPECLSVIQKMKELNFPCYIIDEPPQFILDGKKISQSFDVSFKIGKDINVLSEEIEKLNLPSPVTKLKGAYVTVIPGQSMDVFVMIMPVVPGTQVGGEILYKGNKIIVEQTNSLSIYHIDSNGSTRVF